MNDQSDSNRRPRRVHRSAGQWSALIEAQATSGLSIAGFCGEHGLSASSFYRWRRRLEAPGPAGSQRGGFVRLRMSAADDGLARPWAEAGRSDRDVVVVRFLDGVEVHVGGERLGEVVALLRAGSAGDLA